MPKNLRCGASVKTVNKVWNGLVPVFEVQLAKALPMDKITFPKLVQIKYDGVRIIAIKEGDVVEFITRNGKKVNLPAFAKVIRRIDGNIVLDGEMCHSSGKLEDRTKASGMITSAMHGGDIDEEDLVYNVFDAMSLHHWKAMICPVIYTHRLKHVRLLLEEVNSPLLDVAFTFNAKSREALEDRYEMFLNLGYEGLILKDENHLYTFKRTTDWIKLKETKDCDILCIDTYEGKGKYEGDIGGLICTGKVEGKNILVRVGSGLSDADRRLDPEAYKDQTIEVQYNTVIYDTGSKGYSLFLPRFKEVRYDK